MLHGHDDETVTAAEIETPVGRLLVYGTILTWMMDRGADGTSENWVEHHKAIEAHGNDWARLRALDQRQTPNCRRRLQSNARWIAQILLGTQHRLAQRATGQEQSELRH